MAARKLQQEVDKCFKRVSEGVQEFEAIYDKIEQSANAAQKEKLEDNLKKEIKKLQRLRDQIKTWAASNDIKDKGPLLEQRKLIETQMERFKAVEKAMKTKAYSKEGLLSAAKLDPKERAKMEAGEFLANMVDELERQVETLEAEAETIQATMKKGKNHSSKTDRMAEIDRLTERHRWHQGKLELIKRSLENGGVDIEQVSDLEETIRYYVSDGMNEDFMEDDQMYDDLNLEEEEDAYGMKLDNDRVSSQDNQSVQDDTPEVETRPSSLPVKPKPTSDPQITIARRPSAQLKSPLPALATLHAPLSTVPSGSSTSNMKPAALPTRAPGEVLKYASAAAAAAASDRIAPLPPPPDSLPTSNSNPPLPIFAGGRRPSAAASPAATFSQPAVPASVAKPTPPIVDAASVQSQTSTSSQSTITPSTVIQPAASVSQPPIVERSESVKPGPSRGSSSKTPVASEPAESSKAPAQANGVTNGVKATSPVEEDESIYHLPSGLQDLLQSFEATQRRGTNPPSQSTQRMLMASHNNAPTLADVGGPRNYKLENKANTPSYYPQELDPVFDDPRLYSRIDPDTLFYVFYYKQGSYQQYLAAKSLKDQSWRFHTQYQTWFQRHEEPKTITEEYEQGTYRFFDYESTWMNRRKADFKFAYKFLEDAV